ncbi:MAG: hypothetical protein ACRDXX_14430, partial [Stackebrandtia sp.]
NADGYVDSVATDPDGDGQADTVMTDTDGDGYLDSVEYSEEAQQGGPALGTDTEGADPYATS